MQKQTKRKEYNRHKDITLSERIAEVVTRTLL